MYVSCMYDTVEHINFIPCLGPMNTIESIMYVCRRYVLYCVAYQFIPCLGPVTTNGSLMCVCPMFVIYCGSYQFHPMSRTCEYKWKSYVCMPHVYVILWRVSISSHVQDLWIPMDVLCMYVSWMWYTVEHNFIPCPGHVNTNGSLMMYVTCICNTVEHINFTPCPGPVNTYGYVCLIYVQCCGA